MPSPDAGPGGRGTARQKLTDTFVVDYLTVAVLLN